MALVLTRKENESVLIDGDILVTVVQSRDGTVKLAFEAPAEVDIVRRELLDRHLSEDWLKSSCYGFAIRNADGTLYDSVWVNASSAELELTSEYVGKSIVFLLDFLDDLGNQETSTFYDIGEVFEDPEENNAVNVPAMGGIGLLALGLSILGLGAVSLRKK